MLASAVSIAAALVLAGLALSYIFERHVERRVTSELEATINQLASVLEATPEDQIEMTGDIADPRFELPLSGRYWQVTVDGEIIESSASLWDETIVVPPDATPTGVLHRHDVKGPNDTDLLVLERTIVFNTGKKDHNVSLIAAMDRKEISSSVGEFTRELAVSLLLLGVFLMTAAWFQVLVGLRPFELLRQGLGSLRARTADTLAGKYPTEVMPLVDELNDLLRAQQRSLARARARAGDLAHGLKTPLTVLNSIARSLSEKGIVEEAAEVREQVGAMHRHVERELTRARVAGGRSGKLTPLADAVAKVVNTMGRLQRGDMLDWQLEIPPDFRVAIDPDDLSELLGNLLDNAREWARARVLVCAGTTGGVDYLSVEDDGPGVPSDKLQEILLRGVRLDESRTGSGLGLAIVNDIAEAYGFTVETFKSSLGGLGIRLILTSKGSRSPEVATTRATVMK